MPTAMNHPIRERIKVGIVWMAHVFTWPLAIPAYLEYKWLGQERIFDFFAKLLSLVPGMPGQFIRASFYLQTLPQCHHDVSIGFGSFFSHITAEVGRRVKIGSFSIIGTARLEDNVVIASRVSILSGKYQHGGGHRGRDIKNNAVHYEMVRIGQGTWLGEGSVVMATIGNSCIVSAGSVVTKPMPDECTAIGNPARFVRYAAVKVNKAGVTRPAKLSGQAVMGFVIAGLLLGPSIDGEAAMQDAHIVLVGASIGRAWKVDALPARTGIDGVRFEYVGLPDTFDKSPAVAALVARERRPDAVVIKQCSVFFPGPMERYRAWIETWVAQLEDAGIRPVLATVVPIARPEHFSDRLKDSVRAWLPGHVSKMEQVQAFNGWLREYSRQRGLPLLDLAAALADADGFLRAEYAAGDRVHLNAAAYARLDAAAHELVRGPVGQLNRLDHAVSTRPRT